MEIKEENIPWIGKSWNVLIEEKKTDNHVFYIGLIFRSFEIIFIFWLVLVI